MAGSETGESETESPRLQIDPKCIRDALGTFFKPTKVNDPRLDFYTVYNEAANEYDADYIEKYDENLNTTLLFAGLFSAVNSVFVIDVYSKLQPNPNDQSTALLHAILLTLNHSAIPNETFLVSTTQKDYPPEVVAATCLLYASLMLSLLAAFGAMLGRQWLNRYSRHAGGSMIERCGDRQRKCDGLKKWRFHLFIEALPLMLQVALLLLSCGLYKYMSSINTHAAHTIISLTGFGALFYIGVLIAGASSYDCPFRAPASALLHHMWKKAQPHLLTLWKKLPHLLLTLWKKLQAPFLALLKKIRSTHCPQFAHRRVQFPFPPSQSPPLSTTQEAPRLHHPQTTICWLEEKDLILIQKANTCNVLCVSWVLTRITDPETLDAAIQLAGIILWFEGPTSMKPLYDLIVSAFCACFGSNKELHPGLRNRAYYSGRAILWIHILAARRHNNFASMFPLPTTSYTSPASDCDLGQLLLAFHPDNSGVYIKELLRVNNANTSSHSQWISNALLHLSCAALHFDQTLLQLYLQDIQASTPLDVTFNRLLMCCNLLSSPIEDKVLKIQDKSDRVSQVLAEVSRAIVSALKTSHPQCKLIPEVLRVLIQLDYLPPKQLPEVAYEWCTVICENSQNYGDWDWETLLNLSLEVGFRNLPPPQTWTSLKLTRAKSHQKFVDTALNSKDSEAIIDLICVSYMVGGCQSVLECCESYIKDATRPVTPRLQKVFSTCVELNGLKAVKSGREGVFVGLLNHLKIGIKDMALPPKSTEWTTILLEIVQFPGAAQDLACHYWELLAELVTSGVSKTGTYNPLVLDSLLEAQEMDKLECWMGVVWMLWPPGLGNAVTGGLEYKTASLFRKSSDSVQKLTQWMNRWSEECKADVPESFRRICEQVLHE